MAMQQYQEGAGALTPRLTARETMAMASEWAAALQDVVEKQHMYAVVSGKKYPEVDAWQLVLMYAGYSPVTEYTRPMLNDLGELVAVEAKVNLVDGLGNVVGGGIARCGMDSFPTRGREDHEDKYRAAESAAQTWAISKAARMKLGFVMKLAGYQATPADEMRVGPEAKAVASEPDEDTALCPTHNERWFKSAKMRDWAHKIEGSNDWCNYPRDEQRRNYVEMATAAGVKPTPHMQEMYGERGFAALSPIEVKKLIDGVMPSEGAPVDQPPLIDVEVEDAPQ